jgi:hypothetical protein
MGCAHKCAGGGHRSASRHLKESAGTCIGSGRPIMFGIAWPSEPLAAPQPPNGAGCAERPFRALCPPPGCPRRHDDGVRPVAGGHVGTWGANKEHEGLTIVSPSFRDSKIAFARRFQFRSGYMVLRATGRRKCRHFRPSTLRHYPVAALGLTGRFPKYTVAFSKIAVADFPK